MQWLRQSTAAIVKLGPFVDATDGSTAETALTISQADIRLSKAGGSFAQSNNVAGATHDENGYYGVPLDVTDTNTVGRLRVAVNETGALPVWQDFMVVPAVVFDAMVSGTDKLDVNAAEISGDSGAADNLEAILDGTGGVTLGYFLISGAAAGQHGLTITGGSGMDGLRLVGGGIGGWSLNVADYIYTGVGIYGGAVELFQTIADRTLLASQYGTSTNQATILARIGAFLGTGTNTIYGWLRSLLRKDVAAPSDIGGTYDPATDSLEAIRDYAGSGTSVLTTDDLDAMATQLIADLATAHGSGAWGSTSVSISTTEQTIQTGD